MHPQYYNTQRKRLQISEYGRIVQDMVDLMKNQEDRTKRNLMAAGIVNIMTNLNPQIRELADYKHKLWDHLFAMAGYDLDIDAPFPRPETDLLTKKPEAIPYQKSQVKYRFYGRSVEHMISKAAEMEDGETKSAYINVIASFMRNSCKSWNDENLSEEAICEHIKHLSKGKLELSANEITLMFQGKDNIRNTSGFLKPEGSYLRNNRNKKNNRNNKGKDNRNAPFQKRRF